MPGYGRPDAGFPAAAHNRLGPAKIDQHVAVFHPLDDTVHHFADAVLIFLVLPLPLGLAHLLYNDLLGGLGRYPAKIYGRQNL